MKKYIIILLALLIFSCDEDNIVKVDRVNAKKEGWVKVGEYDIIDEQDILLNDMTVFNSHFIGIGDIPNLADMHGILFNSIDSGKTWNSIDYNFGYYYPNYYIYEDLIVTLSGNLNWSTDVGNSWNTKIYPYNPDNDFEFAMYFSRVNVNCSYLFTNHSLYKSTNNDYTTWERIETSLNYSKIKNKNQEIITTGIRFMHFVNESKGFFIDIENKQIITTEDACKTFNKYSFDIDELLDYQLEFPHYYIENHIKFVGDDVIYFLKSDGLFKSENFGKTWNKLYPFTPAYRDKVQVIDENYIFVKQYRHRLEYDIFASTDGGLSFVKQELPDSIKIKDFHFLDKNTGWAIGSNREILKTTSGGFKDN